MFFFGRTTELALGLWPLRCVVWVAAVWVGVGVGVFFWCAVAELLPDHPFCTSCCCFVSLFYGFVVLFVLPIWLDVRFHAPLD